MTTAAKLVAAKFQAVQARALIGDVDKGATATGSSASDAYAVGAALTDFSTVAASTGAILPVANAGDHFVIANRGANALTVYPPTGGSLNGTTSFSVAANRAGIFFCVNTDDFVSVYGTAA